jgi:hypothetical protein
MSRFKENTFNPQYPATFDKSGEVQQIEVQQPYEVGETWSPIQRLDLLPAFSELLDTRIAAPGRQTMYRQVKSNDDLLPWVTSDLNEVSFIHPNGTTTKTNNDFFGWIYNNTTWYERHLNNFLSEWGNPPNQILITHIHIISNNIQFAPAGNQHAYFQTADVIFYGQQNPNPYIPTPPPTPPCEIYTNYLWGKQYDFKPATSGIMSVDATLASVELNSKPGGNFTGGLGQFNISPSPESLRLLAPGDEYAIKISFDTIAAGTTIPLILTIQGIVLPTINLSNSSANPMYIPVTYVGGNYTFRTQFLSQTGNGENHTNIDFELATATCLIV